MRKLYLAIALVVVCSPIFAQQQQQQMPQMTPEQKAMMDAWMKFATPGDAHKALDSMTGNWDAKVTLWEAPGAQPHTSTATSEAHWVLGNRYVEETVNGTFMGMPFQGMRVRTAARARTGSRWQLVRVIRRASSGTGGPASSPTMVAAEGE